jgi:hypothetical protein
LTRIAIAVAVALVAVVAANVLLLGYGRDRHDPVGRLSPVANLPAIPATVPRAPTTTGGDDRHADD